jgi:uncharacterized BrkB/YihY/UPF0761 family membrane protein
MSNSIPRTGRVVQALALIVALYVLASFIHWTGPNSRVRWDPRLMYPAIAIITAWGVARIARRW